MSARIPVILFIGFSLFFLAFLHQHHYKSIDYLCYERAAQRVILGANPYPETKYEYPPLMAQVMAFTVSRLNDFSPDSDHWRILFNLYQAAQFLLLITAFLLLRQLAFRLGIKEPHASVIILVLCLANVPLYRTLLYNQTNLWILNILLFAILYSNSHGRLSGLFVAFGALLKLYPYLMFSPWMLLRKKKPVLYALLGLLIITAVQTRLFTDFTLYRQYLTFFFNDYPNYSQFRNNCLKSLSINTVNAVRWHVVPMELSTLRTLSGVLTALLTCLALGWFVIRALQRERAFRGVSATAASSIGSLPAGEIRELGHYMDMLPLMLLVAPTLWEHHFVLVMPFTLWAFAVIGRERPVRFGLAFLLIFAAPIIEVFPISYHRLLGLLLLVTLVPANPLKSK